MKATCQTDREWELWEAANRQVSNPSPSPCHDCPASFAAEMTAEGRCEPRVFSGRRRTAENSDSRRAHWRAASREYRARRRAAA
jgi:hypothetical protein